MEKNRRERRKRGRKEEKQVWRNYRQDYLITASDLGLFCFVDQIINKN